MKKLLLTILLLGAIGAGAGAYYKYRNAPAEPTITTATKGRNLNVAGGSQWPALLTQDDILALNVDSITTIQRVTLALVVAG